MFLRNIFFFYEHPQTNGWQYQRSQGDGRTFQIEIGLKGQRYRLRGNRGPLVLDNIV